MTANYVVSNLAGMSATYQVATNEGHADGNTGWLQEGMMAESRTLGFNIALNSTRTRSRNTTPYRRLCSPRLAGCEKRHRALLEDEARTPWLIRQQ